MKKAENQVGAKNPGTGLNPYQWSRAPKGPCSLQKTKRTRHNRCTSEDPQGPSVLLEGKDTVKETEPTVDMVTSTPLVRPTEKYAQTVIPAMENSNTKTKPQKSSKHGTNCKHADGRCRRGEEGGTGGGNKGASGSASGSPNSSSRPKLQKRFQNRGARPHRISTRVS